MCCAGGCNELVCGPHGSVTQWRIVSTPSVCLLVCFRLPKAIWSILPVIICLSQRLIRACLSSHCFTVKQQWLFKSFEIPEMPQSYFENCGISRAKISLPNPGKAAGAQLIHSRHGEVMMKKHNSGFFPRPF